MKARKNPPPPIGHYHPKFNEMDVKVHHSNIRYHYKCQTSRKQREELGNFELENTVIADKLPRKVNYVALPN